MNCMCGYPKHQHEPETLVCPGSAGRAGQTYRTRKLPAGTTCADCFHFKRCEWLISYTGTETACDWFPIRFHRKPEREAA